MPDDNKPVLFLVQVILEVPSADAGQQADAILQASSHLRSGIESALGELPEHLGYQGTSFVHIYEEDVNSGRCAVCGLY